MNESAFLNESSESVIHDYPFIKDLILLKRINEMNDSGKKISDLPPPAGGFSFIFNV